MTAVIETSPPAPDQQRRTYLGVEPIIVTRTGRTIDDKGTKSKDETHYISYKDISAGCTFTYRVIAQGGHVLYAEAGQKFEIINESGELISSKSTFSFGFHDVHILQTGRGVVTSEPGGGTTKAVLDAVFAFITPENTGGLFSADDAKEFSESHVKSSPVCEIALTIDKATERDQVRRWGGIPHQTVANWFGQGLEDPTPGGHSPTLA